MNMNIDKYIIYITLVLIALLILEIVSIKSKLNTARKKIISTESNNEILRKHISNYADEIRNYKNAFSYLKSLFYSQPKSISNGIIKNSFEIKDTGGTSNTIKVTGENKIVKRQTIKGRIFFQSGDKKEFISFEDVKLACSTLSIINFNTIFKDCLKHLKDIKKEDELPIKKTK